MSELAEKQCIPCKGGIPPLSGIELKELSEKLGGNWKIEGEHHLEKEFYVKNFMEALNFTNIVGALAEEQGHHPNILVEWGKATISIWTHKINGLTESDFILAAKIDEAWKDFQEHIGS